MPGTILLVGRDTPQMEIVRSRLKPEFEVVTAEETTDALAHACESDIDVMVINIRDLMADGVGLVRRLKNMNSPIEVITLNIPSALRYSIESMKLGAFDDVIMPFDLDELARKISKALKKARSRKGGPSLRRRLEDLAASVAFAEAGEFDTSVEISRKSNPPACDERAGDPCQGGNNGPR